MTPLAFRRGSVTIQKIGSSHRARDRRQALTTKKNPDGKEEMTTFWTTVRSSVRRFDDWTLHAFNPQYPVGSRS
ncbi:hypothetical protein GCM10010472_41490 [Pseudonocardia halophobica]|uniref:Uncharacterized protein n=1 Tax=Pseudonocardia halophobica TaxID=29401 RepID=A0A9W6NX29_9PSEU|nr:hypothetical protein GCM10017577_36050 [Pseudonocardia halophobica]